MQDSSDQKAGERSPSGDKPLLGLRQIVTIAAFVSLVLTSFAWSESGEIFELAGPRMLAFRLRERVGEAPKLDPKLKIFAFEDRSAHELGFTDLPLKDWQAVIESIAARRPRAILIDKTFAHPLDPEAAQDFAERIQATGVPVIAKAHVSRSSLMFLQPLSLAKSTIELRKQSGDIPSPVPWLPPTLYRAYGPSLKVGDGFAALGHDENINPHEVQPALSLIGGHQLLHWTLHAAEKRSIEQSALYLDGHRVPVNLKGRIPVNLVSFQECMARIRSISDVLARLRDGLPLTSVEPDDVVVILTDLYTGAVSFEDTAIGRIPLGFVNLGMINSVLTGKWLHTTGGTIPLIIIASLLGGWLASKLQSQNFALRILGVAILLTAAALAAFVYGNILIPWALPLLALVASGLICNFEQMRAADQRAQMLRRVLGSNVSPDKLQRLLRGDDRLALDATERVVTVMFIDIVGFSRAAESQTPKEAFSSLKELISSLRQTIHEFGGDVDRTMGDGMLCVFGNDSSSLRHADQAVNCALKIQRENLRRILEAKPGQAVFPVRIGINTAGVYVGNLGDTERVDLTIIGNGVNFGQRLEAACDRHMVMIGASTRDLLSALDDEHRMLRKRAIRIKHSEELVEAYEVDPFHDNPQLLLAGDEAYRLLIGVERHDTRWPIPIPGLIRFKSNLGDGVLINFSFDGFTVRLPSYYAKDVTMTARLDDASGEVGPRLEQAGLVPLVLEVRWARPADSGFIHGCMIKNLNQEQRGLVIGILRDCVQKAMSLSRSA